MKYREYPPIAPLGNCINCFWSLEPAPGETPHPAWDRTVPDGSLEIVLHLGEPMRRKPLHGDAAQESRAVLIGQTTEPYLIAPAGRTRMLGLRFFPHAGFRFLDGPVAPFNDRSMDLDAILPRGARLPVEEAGNADTIPAAIRILENWCLRRLGDRRPNVRDDYFSYACRMLLRNRGSISIAALGRELGISNRYLERLFLERSGISPKLFARIIRFQHALGFMANGTRPLAAVAQETGHFDQPHFIREFRRFTGLAPREFAEEQHPFTGHFAEPANSSYLYNFR